MSDVREQLISVIAVETGLGASNFRIGDAILERFDVTPKPVITDEALGKLCMSACCVSGGDADYVGMRLAERLADAGLQIVKVDE